MLVFHIFILCCCFETRKRETKSLSKLLEKLKGTCVRASLRLALAAAINQVFGFASNTGKAVTEQNGTINNFNNFYVFPTFSSAAYHFAFSTLSVPYKRTRGKQ